MTSQTGITYYATFKVRRFESLFYKIATCFWLWAKQIFLVNIKYIYFSSLGMAFAVPFLCYFQKFWLLLKNFWTNFCYIVLLYLWVQKVCLRFLKSYFKLEILIFLSFVVSFSVDMFNSKALFLTKKTSMVKSETHLSRESTKN